MYDIIYVHVEICSRVDGLVWERVGGVLRGGGWDVVTGYCEPNCTCNACMFLGSTNSHWCLEYTAHKNK